MNSSPYSKVLLALIVLLSVAGAANAVTISSADAPDDATIGNQVTATVELDELYDQYDTWTLRGVTNLTEVTWTVRNYDVGDDPAGESSYDGTSFEHPIDKDDGIARVTVEITATVPEVDTWSYDPPQQITVASFTQVREGGTSNAVGDPVTLRPHTEDSQEARDAIDDASATIEDAGGHERAESKLQQAIDAYEKESFGLAVDLANEAADTARSSQQQSRTLRLGLYALGAVILLAVLIGGVYWYRSNRTGSKL